jgi:tetratricopeptide (TPR) repeat protein
MQPAGLYTFFHQYLRDAVRERYITDEQAEREAHAHIARYFADTPPSERRRDEEPWQWIEAKEKERAIETLSDITLFPLLAEAERHYELLAYWTKLDANDEMPAAYEKLYEKAKATLTPYEQADIFVTLGQFLTRASLFTAAEKPLEEAVALSDEVYKDDISKRANAIRELATVYLHQRKLTEAEASYLQAIELYKGINDLKELSETETNLAVVYYKFGEYEKAIILQKEAIDIAVKYYGKIHPVISEFINNLATNYFFQGSFTDAELLWEEAIEIAKKTRGDIHSHTILLMKNLALLKTKLLKFDDALSIYDYSVKMLPITLGKWHSAVGAAYRSRASVLTKLGRIEEAEVDCFASIEIGTILFGETDSRTIESYLVLAEIRVQQGKYDEARKLYVQYLPLKINIFGVNHSQVDKTGREYIQLLEKMGMREEIQKIYYDIPSLNPQR